MKKGVAKTMATPKSSVDIGTHRNSTSETYKFVDGSSSVSNPSNAASSGISVPRTNIYYNIYTMPFSRGVMAGCGVLCGDRWWLLPSEVYGSSRFMLEVGGRVYWFVRRFAEGGVDVNLLGVDAAAGYGKTLDAARLAVDLSYEGWLVIIAVHSHDLGRKVLEYILRYFYVREGLTGKWWRKVKVLMPADLPRVLYVGGMERYCPFMDVVADKCRSDDKTCNVVRYMFERSGVPQHMWGKSVRFLIEHKILNAKQFCESCPLMRVKSRLRPLPRDYLPSRGSWFGPRILYTKDVEDIVEKFLFYLIHDYDSRRREWRKGKFAKYVKLIDPRYGVCPRRILLKPLISRCYKRKGDGKVVFYNFWIYHGGMVVIAPYDIALKIARIAYHVRNGRKMLLIVDEADALLFKREYVPVFSPSEFEKEIELVRRYLEFMLWYLKNDGADFDAVFREFKSVVGSYIRKKDLFLRELLSWIIRNKDRIISALDEWLYILMQYAREYYLDYSLDLEELYRSGKLFDSQFIRRLSEWLASVVGYVKPSDYGDFSRALGVVRSLDFDALRFWNILYVLSMKSQRRLSVVPTIRVTDSDYRDYLRFGGGRYVGSVVEVEAESKISPLYSLYLLSRGVPSLVLIDGVLYYEYYPCLREVFELAKMVKVVLMSATLLTYFVNMSEYINIIASELGVRYYVFTLLGVEDIYFKRSLRKRVGVYEDPSLRDIRVHRVLIYLPEPLVRLFESRFSSSLHYFVESVKSVGSGVVIVVQNKMTAEYLAKVFSAVFRDYPVVFDSGYYFRSRLLITWLRSKLNRGVNIQDFDPNFVPRLFIFVGTFMSGVQRVVMLEYGELGVWGHVWFSLGFAKYRWFIAGAVDVVYGTEVICWIEQFVGRALRVSRMYNVDVSIVLPVGVAGYAVGSYIMAVKLLPDDGTVEYYLKQIDEYKKRASISRSEKEKELLLKRVERMIEIIRDPKKLVDVTGAVLLKRIGLGHLVDEFVQMYSSII